MLYIHTSLKNPTVWQNLTLHFHKVLNQSCDIVGKYVEVSASKLFLLMFGGMQPFIIMNLHEPKWTPMNRHEHHELSRIVMCCHESSWNIMNLHELSWTVCIAINCLDFSWIVMNCHESSWNIMNLHELSWAVCIAMNFIICHEWSWIVIKSHKLLTAQTIGRT